MKELWNCVLLADAVDPEMDFFHAYGVSWMEVAVVSMVGLVVIFAVFAIFFIHRHKRDERDEQLRKEAEREEHEYGGHV